MISTKLDAPSMNTHTYIHTYTHRYIYINMLETLYSILEAIENAARSRNSLNNKYFNKNGKTNFFYVILCDSVCLCLMNLFELLNIFP